MKSNQTEIVWNVEESINDGEACIHGSHPVFGECLYTVDYRGDCEIYDLDTDSDFDGKGWPEPPRELILEATSLAKGSL